MKGKIKVAFDPEVPLRDVIKAYVVLAVDANDGCKAKAAKQLGITEKTVYNYLNKWGFLRAYGAWINGLMGDRIAALVWIHKPNFDEAALERAVKGMQFDYVGDASALTAAHIFSRGARWHHAAGCCSISLPGGA